MLERTLTARDGRSIALRELTAADGEAFAAHVRGDLDRLSEHLAWPARTTTPAEAAAWIARYDERAEGRVVLLGLWDGDELLGGVLLMSHDPATGEAEVGCWVVAGGEGLGLVAEGCRVLIDHALTLGVQRLTWHAAVGNVRSRRLAERLGFIHEGTARAAYPLRGGRLDVDVLALLADEAAVAAVVRAFYAAFASGADVAERIDGLRDLLLPGAVVVRTGVAGFAAYDVDGFLAPRRALLCGGGLVDFREWEVDGRTELLGDVAQRRSTYAKAGTQDGAAFTGGGTKALQLVRTATGWRISAVAWHDVA